MKKLLLGLGTLASVAAPVAAVVACGSSTPEAKFVTATAEQETAVTAVTTEITPLAGGLPKTSTEISGNKVRYTFGAVPTAADASDDASTVTAKTYVVKTFTVDLESGKIIDAQAAEADGKFESIIDTDEVKGAASVIATASTTAKDALEQANADAALVKAKEDAKSKVAVISGIADADKNAANKAIDAAKDQTEIDAAIAAAQSSVTSVPVQPQTGNTGNIVEKDQDAVDAEQLVINALVPVSIDKYDSVDDAPNGTLTTIIAAGLGLTSFTPKDGFTYEITDSTATTVTITVGSEAHAGTEGTPVAITLVIKAAPAAGNAGNPSGPDAGKTIAPTEFNDLTDAQIVALNAALTTEATSLQTEFESGKSAAIAAGTAAGADAKDASNNKVGAKLVRILQADFDGARDVNKNGVDHKTSPTALAEQPEGTVDTIVVFEYTDEGFKTAFGYYATADDFKTATGIDKDDANNFYKLDYTKVNELLKTLTVA